MLSSDFLFPRFFVVPLANPSNFSHCKCFSSRIYIELRIGEALCPPPLAERLLCRPWSRDTVDIEQAS